MSYDPKTSLAILERLANLDFADLEKRIIYFSLEHDNAAPAIKEHE